MQIIRRAAAGQMLFFVSLPLVARAIQAPQCWCIVPFKMLCNIFPTSSCLSRSAQSLRHPVLYLPSLLQVSWILWDVKNGTWCLCLGLASLPTWQSCETLTLLEEWEQFPLQFIGKVKSRLTVDKSGWLVYKRLLCSTDGKKLLDLD